MESRVPFTMLTGFLGAGKTTALNRLLSAQVQRRVAVLVNDLGRVNIDRQLITARSGDLVELSGGCVCCTLNVQRDLWAGILDLLERARPDQLILETTGIAEPHVVLDRLADAAQPRERVFAAGVIAVVDGQDGARTRAERPEARAQLEHSERVLLAKLDVASVAEASGARAAIRALNTEAELAAFPAGGAGTEALARFLLEVRPLLPKAAAWLERAPAEDDESTRSGAPSQDSPRADDPGHDAPHPAGHAHAGHGQLSVVTFTDDAVFLPRAVEEVLLALGEALVRVKGFLRVDGEGGRLFVEKAGQSGLTFQRASPGLRTELVLIGERLDDHALHRQLWACRAQR